MKKILSILLISIILWGCKKKVIEGTYTIKGRLYYGCDKSPKKNTSLELKDYYYENNRPKYQTIGSVITDSLGNFSFSYSNAPDGEIYIVSAGYPYPGYINNIPFQNIDSLSIFTKATANIKSNILVTNTYTNKDTLFVYAYDGYYKNYKLVGPFSNGRLLPDYEYKNLLYFDYNNYKKKTGISYKIGTNNNWIDSNIYISPCSQNTINIEIK